jgi:hypothetical protein
VNIAAAEEEDEVDMRAVGEEDIMVVEGEGRGNGLRRRIFWIWGSIWIRRLRWSLLVVERVSSASFILFTPLLGAWLDLDCSCAGDVDWWLERNWKREGDHEETQDKSYANSPLTVTGTLKGYDALMNLVLDDVDEVVRGTYRFFSSSSYQN